MRFLFVFFLVSVCHFAGFAQSLVTLLDYNTEKTIRLTEICENVDQIQCRVLSEFGPEHNQIQSLLQSQNFAAHIEVIRPGGANQLIVNTHQLHRANGFDALDFRSTQNVYFGDTESLNQSLKNHLKQVRNFKLYGDALKLTVLKQIYLNKESRNGINEMTWREFLKHISFENENEREVARAYVQIAASLAFASYIYWDNWVKNSVDFDYDDFDKKIKDTVLSTRGWNFDTNHESLNTGHALAGVVYYQAARNNGFSALTSFAITNLSSLWWEVIGERKESASINDQFITGIGGSIMGEALYQVSQLMRKKSNSLLSRALRGSIDPLGVLNRYLNRRAGFRAHEFKQLTDSDFNRIETSLARVVSGDAATKVKFQGETLNIENYGEPGRETGIIVDTAAAKVIVEFTQNRLSQRDIKFLTQVAWLSIYNKRVQENGEGVSSLISLSGEVSYENKTTGYDDYHLNVGLVGPHVRIDGLFRGVQIHLEAAVYADFVMIKSLALPEFDNAARNSSKLMSSRQGLQSHVKQQGHHYGFGATQFMRLALSYRDWTGYIDYRHFSARSIQGVDRFQSEVTLGDRYKDTKSHSTAGLRYNISSTLALTLSRERVRRTGEMTTNSTDPFHIQKTYSRTWIELHHKW